MVCANSEGQAANTNCFITPRELSPHKVTVMLWENLSEKKKILFVIFHYKPLYNSLLFSNYFYGVIKSLWRMAVVSNSNSRIIDLQNSETFDLNVLQICC